MTSPTIEDVFAFFRRWEAQGTAQECLWLHEMRIIVKEIESLRAEIERLHGIEADYDLLALTQRKLVEDYQALAARCKEAEAKLAECRQALADALALAKKVIGHTAPYLQEKWRLPEELARLRAALADESVYPDAGGQT